MLEIRQSIPEVAYKLPAGGQSIEEFAAGSTASTEIVNGFGIAGEY